MTAVYYMLLRNEMYNPQINMDSAPSKGNITLHNLISYYISKGYTIVTDQGEIIKSA